MYVIKMRNGKKYCIIVCHLIVLLEGVGQSTKSVKYP